MRNLFTCCLLLLYMLPAWVYGQQNRISGKVTDALTSGGIPGVTVMVKGTSAATQTDGTGNYSIEAAGTDTLIFRSLGFATQEVAIAGRTSVDVVLEDQGTELEEVVVIGYGTAQKRDLTGSIARVSGADIADRPAANPVASLQGRVSGVQVTNSGRPGQEPDVRIRGTNSINNVRPLYVVDGILNDNIDFLNPADIESMEILKDPSSLAIFGVRGANGVIAITTKQAKAGQLNFNFNSTVGFKSVVDRMAMTDAAGFRMLYDEQLANQGSTPFNYNGWTANTDWQNEIFQTGMLNYNNISVSGASEKNKFYMGLGYTLDQGIIKHEQLDKITVTINDQLSITDNFRVGVNLNAYHADLPPPQDIMESAVGSALRAAPIAPVFNEEYGLYHTLPLFQRAQISNPLTNVELRRGNFIRHEYRGVGSVFGEVDFLQHFTFRASFLGDFGFNKDRSYTPLRNYYNPDLTGDDKTDRVGLLTDVNQGQNNMTKLQTDWLLTYKNTFGEHSLTALVGYTTYSTRFEGLTARRGQGSGDPIPNDPDKWFVGIGSTDTQESNGTAWERRTISYLGRVLYNYQGKYLLNASFRRDGSSAFIESNPWQNFGSVGAAWVISEENFLSEASFIDNLKIKGSWGVLGNQNTGDDYRYPMFPLLVANSSAVFGNNIFPGYEPQYIPDPNLQWETVTAWEAGFEFTGFASRLTMEANYYNKLTRHIMVEVPGILGTKPGLSNQGTIKNHGIELAASWNQQLNDDWSFSVGANLTTLSNEVTFLVNEGYQILRNASRTTVGYPIGYFYGYVHDGIFQNEAEVAAGPTNAMGSGNNVFLPGDIRYKDINGDNRIDASDRTMIGNPTPDFIYGANISVTFRQFDLGVEVMGVQGNEIFRDWNRNQFAQFNFQADRLNRWHGVGTSNWEPILNTSRANNREISSYFIEDGSFVRIRNIQLGYNLAQEVATRLRLKNVRMFVNAQNPFTFAKNTGYTPEIGGSAIQFGVDNGTYPVPAIYTFGINLNF
ncbi:TonB-linked outer membrane protein, SusC/RagA family [Parapedobacter luteus]|uniref:TonB-linked outer membrane protein, SusC/RagA family n=1 Tax=Parapedobacter luteus TaxID=623280 RepID=A0A1T5D9Q8_9SPHI|nr:TonB-dependent receptor [Parapedobacter luteus]SKB68283.1 TonB-linked outer membrane protein, SusC/RagA family [Parapedobacter luteus]